MTEKIYVQTFLYVWLFILVVSPLIWWVSTFDYMISFVLGAVSSVLLMSHNYKTTMKTAYKDPERLKVRTLQNYVFRFAFYILILLIVWFRYQTVGHLLLTFVGLVSFKFVMLFNFFISGLRHDEGEDLDA